MLAVIILILGLCAGSFVNAFVWRLHQQSTIKSNKAKKEFSIATGRSMCVRCKHTLQWYDLIPVLSWFILGGKCRYCHKVISVQYPIVELLTSGLFLLSYFAWVDNWSSSTVFGFISWLITLTGLMSLAVYDVLWRQLPTRLIYPLYIPVLIYVATAVAEASHPLQAALQAAIGSVALGGLFWGIYQFSKGKWIGGGDIRLGFLLGLLSVSFINAVLLLFIASVIGTLISVILLLAHKANVKTHLAFGPLLITGGIIVVLYGTQIINWYDHVILLTT